MTVCQTLLPSFIGSLAIWCNNLIRHHLPVHIMCNYEQNTRLCALLGCAVHHLPCLFQDYGGPLLQLWSLTLGSIKYFYRESTGRTKANEHGDVSGAKFRFPGDPISPTSRGVPWNTPKNQVCTDMLICHICTITEAKRMND